MTHLDECLGLLKPDRNVRKAVNAVARRRGLVCAYLRSVPYVSLRPDDGSSIACYIHPGRISIGLPSDLAGSEQARIKGSSRENSKGPVDHIRVGEAAIGVQLEAVVDLMVLSLDWRAGNVSAHT